MAKKSEILIEELVEDELLLRPVYENFTSQYVYNLDLSEKTLETPREWNFIHKQIISAYISGADLIRISHKEGIPFTLRDKVVEALRQMFGFEIIHENDNLIEIQTITKQVSVEFLLKRAFESTLQMVKLVYKFLEEHPPHLKLIEKRDDEIDRFRLITERYMRKLLLKPCSEAYSVEGQGLSSVEGLHYLLVMRYIERIADHFISISGFILQSDSTQKRKMRSNIKEIEALLQSTMDLVTSRSIENAPDIFLRSEALKKKWKDEPEDKISSQLVVGHIIRIVDYCTDIIEVILDLKTLEEVEFVVQKE